MIMIKCLIALVMCLVVRAHEEVKKDYNHEAHNALCDLMRAAVGKWEKRQEGLSDKLKKALGRTLFGNEEGGDITELKRKLPDYYEAVLKGNAARRTPCGGSESDQSAPYDMVCLCTLGDGGWPLNGIQTETTLCGQPKTALGGGVEGWSDERLSDEDWSDEERNKGEKELNATWGNVVTPCLESNLGKDLKEALEQFKGKLVNKSDDYFPGMYQLGEGEPDKNGACTGSKKYGVCVMYNNGTKTMDHRPWWVDLEKAIPQEETFQEEKRRKEEERRKQQEKSEGIDEPRAEPLTSRLPNTNQTQRSDTESSNTQFHRLNMTSGTLITPPCTWLLRALLFI
ncbi:Variant surface glycoprotein [Trypanosoma congolense IL3000]|uniref:Variant surface glycoprotein n=1 Tax=Trypanosoma congolense (strain IL3000) TaxID=1068625 RepID=F9WG57_TRYCI|nr:Variant surface glycoprotein [Trypanosoma congolense IL3000]